MNLLERLDASLPLTDDERMLLASVQSVCRDVIAPQAEPCDRAAQFPQASVDAINGLGLNAMFIPEAYGGAPLSYLCYLACVREVSKACASTGIIWATNFHGMKPLIDWGNEEQKSRLLPRILAWLLAGGGVGYLVDTGCKLLWPEYRASALADYATLPAALGEIGTCLWMLVFGIRRPVD